MATAPVADQGKGKFLREFLRSNRDAKVVDATAAWKAEGHDDGISQSLVSKIRSELGLTKKKGSNGRATGKAASPTAKGKADSSPKGTKAKERPEESPLPTDVEEGSKGPSRSAFVEELLGREPGANLKKVNEAWAAAGHEGTISSSVFFKVKRERGGTGEPALGPKLDRAVEQEPSPRGDKAAPAASTAKTAPKASKPPESASPRRIGEAASPVTKPATADRADDHGRELHRIEGEIDELMFRLKGLGSFAEVQEALRAARRLLVRSHHH